MMFNKLIAQKLVVALTLMGTTIALAPMTVAQSIDSVDKENYQSNEATPNGELGDFMNPLNLMHRANLERSRSGGEFAEDTRSSLNEAAQSFKEIQRQRLEAEMKGVSTEANSQN
jgi:hypothetical protein